jgi:hypothetical protein
MYSTYTRGALNIILNKNDIAAAVADEDDTVADTAVGIAT